MACLSDGYVNAEQFNAVAQYSEATGKPIQDCIKEALADWLTCCAQPRLAALKKVRSPRKLLKKVQPLPKLTAKLPKLPLIPFSERPALLAAL